MDKNPYWAQNDKNNLSDSFFNALDAEISRNVEMALKWAFKETMVWITVGDDLDPVLVVAGPEDPDDLRDILTSRHSVLSVLREFWNEHEPDKELAVINKMLACLEERKQVLVDQQGEE